jgi:LacI family transcriptional regulator
LAVDLRQVAQRSGVSVSTASRALSGSSRVSEETVAKVRAVAAELGYRPNASARTLRTARSAFIGLVVTNLVNTSFHTIAEVVQREFARRGYQLMLSVTGGDPVQERSALRILVDHSAAGVIVVGSDSEATEELRERGTPTVHLARRPRAPAGDCVLGDEISGGRSATEYLLEKGHRRIAIIAGPPDVQSGRERMQGYWLAMQAAGVPVSEELTLAVALSPDAGGPAVGALLALPARRRPTALLVANHEASYGALPALREHSVTIPGDLSVICYEDSQLARWWHPAITVIDNNARQMGELAARLLLQRLDPADRTRADGAREEFSEFRVGTRLIERDSCQPASVSRAASSSVSPSSSQRSRAIGTLPLTHTWSCSAWRSRSAPRSRTASAIRPISWVLPIW